MPVARRSWHVLLVVGLCIVPTAIAQVWPPTAPCAQQPPQQGLPRLIPTRQHCFSIPFQIHQPTSTAAKPREVQLLVSRDQGTHWYPYGTATPDQGYFVFKAVGDGEYWFLLRTVDASGQVRATDTSQPGLRVLVDTTPPTLDFHAQQAPTGQIVANWRIEEANPDPNGFLITYRFAPHEAWRYAPVDRKALGTGENASGTTSWWPENETSTMEIRAEVVDLAGNRNVAHSQLALETVRSETQQIAASQGPPTGEAVGPGNSPSLVSPPDSSRGGVPSGGRAFPYVEDHAATPPRSASDGLSVPRGPRSPWEVHGPSAPNSDPLAVASAMPDPAALDTQTLSRDAYRYGPAASPYGSQVGSNYTPPASGPLNEGTTDGGDYAPGAGLYGDGHRYRAEDPFAGRDMAASRYEVRDDSVEVEKLAMPAYASSSPGTSRDRWGEGDNVTPPAGNSVSLPGDGTGWPRNHAPPTLRSAAVTTVDGQPQVTILWEPGDAAAARSVSLQYATTADGPWDTLVANIRNSGRFVWPFSPGLGRHVFFRLEIEGRDGNIRTDTLRTPVDLGP